MTCRDIIEFSLNDFCWVHWIQCKMSKSKCGMVTVMLWMPQLLYSMITKITYYIYHASQGHLSWAVRWSLSTGIQVESSTPFYLFRVLSSVNTYYVVLLWYQTLDIQTGYGIYLHPVWQHCKVPLHYTTKSYLTSFWPIRTFFAF